MAIVIEDDKQFTDLVKNYQRALEYIRYLESKLDAANYQSQEFNEIFVEAKDDK